METLASLGHGFAVALTPWNLLWSALGVTIGTAIGVLPGIGPALTVALLLPVTYSLEPTSAFIMFAGIYYGAMYGGSTTSILLNTPGESGSIVTAIDGHEMARKGRGAQALATAAIGSFVAGTIATIALTFVAPLMVKVALLFGPAEYFALMVLALTTVTAVLGDSLVRGLSSLFIGLALGLVGIDLQTGQARFTLGIPEMLDGIDTVVVAVGLFAIGETLYVASRYKYETEEIYALKGSMWMSKEDWRAILEAMAARHLPGLPDRRLAGRRLRDPDLPLLPDREAALQEPAGVRPRCHRGGGRSRGRQQCRRGGCAGPSPVAWPADLGHGRDHAGGLPAIWPAARPVAVRQQPGAGLGHDRQPLYRQRAAADPQPADGRGVGEAAGDPAALALRRHPRVRDHGCLHAQQQRGRPGDPVGHRHPGLRHAGARRAGGAVRGRPDPGAVGRAAVPPRAVDQPGRCVGVLHPPDLAGAAGDRGAAGDHAHPDAPPPAARRERRRPPENWQSIETEEKARCCPIRKSG